MYLYGAQLKQVLHELRIHRIFPNRYAPHNQLELIFQTVIFFSGSPSSFSPLNSTAPCF